MSPYATEDPGSHNEIVVWIAQTPGRPRWRDDGIDASACTPTFRQAIRQQACYSAKVFRARPGGRLDMVRRHPDGIPQSKAEARLHRATTETSQNGRSRVQLTLQQVRIWPLHVGRRREFSLGGTYPSLQTCFDASGLSLCPTLEIDRPGRIRVRPWA